MKKFLTIASATGMSLMMALAPMASANAMPFAAVSAPQANAGDVTTVQYHGHRHSNRNDWRRHHRSDRGRHSWRGYHGYNHSRPGYRRHSDGWWYPLAAFGAGAVLGNTLSHSRSSRGSAHVRWCESHYRSYRASDNTYQPYHGPRRQCISQ